ncbi:murein transglycosylase A [Polymorphobacter sp.]|uniref:murein transglycosylase A n=1 Tax=Polymorphobacter sp. TaxID=1909290 RepID=UPI003F6F2C13
MMMRPALALFSMLVLAGCAAQQPPAPAAPGAPPPSAAAAPARAIDLPRRKIDIAIPAADAEAALRAFRASCPRITWRQDRSGLTLPSDWQAVCRDAETATDAVRFFAEGFEGVVLGDDGAGFATGYFEPEIAASRVRSPGYGVPLYRRPPDLVEVDLGTFRPEWQGRTLRGRLDGRRVVPYYGRAPIDEGVLAGKDLELAWAADPNDAFFLEIQGSGRLRLPNGEIMRIGYDSQNGRDYVAIGRVLVDMGELPKDGVSMASIMAWLRANPDRAEQVRQANPSVVFFRELLGLADDDGPRGALNIPVRPQISVAIDPAFIPYGTPLVAQLDGAAPHLHVAMDTGGAIKGPGRLDIFQGSGTVAGAKAGALASKARVVLLLPRRATARL